MKCRHVCTVIVDMRMSCFQNYLFKQKKKNLIIEMGKNYFPFYIQSSGEMQLYTKTLEQQNQVQKWRQDDDTCCRGNRPAKEKNHNYHHDSWNDLA